VNRESTWCRYDAAARRLTLTLHVQPGARKSGLAGLHGGALKVKIAAPAIDNKANTALIEFLSTTLGVPKSSIAVRHGATARRKVVAISGCEELTKRVAALTAG
jgi:uncharacterized protein